MVGRKEAQKLSQAPMVSPPRRKAQRWFAVGRDGARLRGAAGAAGDGSEVAPVAGVDLEGGAEAGDDAAGLGQETKKLEVRERRHDVDGGAEFLAKGGDHLGVGGGVAGDRLGGAGEGEATAGEGVARRGSRVNEEDARARVGAEVPGVGGEPADVDDKGTVGAEEGGGDRGIGGAVGRGGTEHYSRELLAERGDELAGASEGVGHGVGRIRRPQNRGSVKSKCRSRLCRRRR